MNPMYVCAPREAAVEGTPRTEEREVQPWCVYACGQSSVWCVLYERKRGRKTTREGVYKNRNERA